MDPNSMEIKSLQTVLESVNNEAKQHQFEAELNDSKSKISTSLGSTELDSIGTTIKIHSVLSTEGDYEIRLSPENNIESANTKSEMENTHDTPGNREQILRKNKFKTQKTLPDDENRVTQENDSLIMPEEKIVTSEQDLTGFATEKILKTDDDVINLKHDSTEVVKEDQQTIASSSNQPEIIPTSTQDTLQEKQSHSVETEMNTKGALPVEDELEISLAAQNDSDSVITKRSIINEQQKPDHAGDLLIDISKEDNVAEEMTKEAAKPEDEEITMVPDSFNLSKDQTNEKNLIKVDTEKIVKSDSKEDQQTIAPPPNQPEIIPTSTQDTLQEKQSHSIETEMITKGALPVEDELEISLAAQNDSDSVITKRSIKSEQDTLDHAGDLLIDISNEENIAGKEAQKAEKPEDEEVTIVPDAFNLSKNQTNEQDLIEVVTEKIPTFDSMDTPKEEDQQTLSSNRPEIFPILTQDTNNQTIGSGTEDEIQSLLQVEDDLEISIPSPDDSIITIRENKKENDTTDNAEDVLSENINIDNNEDIAKVETQKNSKLNADEVTAADSSEDHPKEIKSDASRSNENDKNKSIEKKKELKDPAAPSDTEILTAAEPSDESKEIKIDLNTEHTNILVSPSRAADSSEDHPKEIKSDASSLNEKDKNKSIEKENKEIKENNGSITRSSSLNSEVNSDNTKLMEIKQPYEDEPSKLEMIEQNLSSSLKEQQSEPTDEDDNEKIKNVILTSTDEAIRGKRLIGNDLKNKESDNFKSPISKSTKNGSTNEQISVSDVDKPPMDNDSDETQKQNLESIDSKDGPSKNPIMKDTTEVEVMDKIPTNKSSEVVKLDSLSPEVNAAGSTSDVEIGLDKALSRSESDSFPKDILMEFLNKEIDFSSGLVPLRVEEAPCERKSDDVSTLDLMKEFLNREIEFSSGIEELPCIKKSISRTTLDQEDNADNETEKRKESNQEQSEIATDLNVLKNGALSGADEIVTAQLEKEDKEDSRIVEQISDETVVRPMSSLQEQASLDVPDGDVIVYNRMQREESRESSAQSESVIFGNSDEDRIVSNEAEITRTQLSRHYTIAGDDPQSIFRSVTIVDAVQFIENEDVDLGTELNSGNSFCLDAETSENIRKKIMAYSLSEADSDYYDPSKIAADDFHIDTAMTDAMDTSTETESTIVSAAAKIQAGARGFLTRRRLRRASAGTKSSTQETKASFGNDAISESLERFIEEEAAKKIQAAYRLHSKKQKKQKQKNAIKSASLESSLAAKRQTLQRGDALQKDSNSTPDDENIESKIVDTIAVQQNERRVQKKANMSLKWPPRRQNSMPVQIECEVLRVIPKHRRRRIKSAEMGKNKLPK
ncbi:interaptin [Drosophila grimshawi]|uniref:interaptin n=1 Tax=Drosophila grimshawi TaxID=7222 RepID=UPI001C9369B3|nr:interaptin [Drosophila grimshawi]